MSDLGVLLRKARLEQKISLDDLQEITKIRKTYLEAIEEGNYKVLPGNFYVRAFIKSYAEAVGLDPNEVLLHYHNVIPASAPDANIETMPKPRVSSRNTERFSKWASNILMISFVILILGIIYYYANSSYESNSKGQPGNGGQRVTDKLAPPAPSPSAAGSSTALTDPKPAQVPIPAPVTKPEVKFVNSDRGVDYYAVTHSGKITIELNVKGDECWVEVDTVTDKKTLLEQGIYKNGSTKTWEVSNSAFVIVGKPNAIEMKVNGTPVQMGDTPNPKRFQLDLIKS
ncbi:helix-turn-helix domain-containing protein [Paenibacillus thalictri]|uniref:Helix-turn-helix domain-containing protein n=1 Tax=Paenibacillus thalictri TaxID=2527873 RepID=A0A4Q9DRL7_9BACL|nr:RodZ domain-containing protein [Paenibacillus thalictri]TBL77797.1 helix-turn-helix domain-containing protein [Paenibacillus thalictri]